jgi:hypothetical protein
LRAVGTWLRRNGESVYGTRPGPIQNDAWCRSTQRPNRVYLHVFDWPAGGVIRLSGIPQPVSGAYLLADPDGAPLPVTRQHDVITVQGPTHAPDAADTVIVLRT